MTNNPTPGEYTQEDRERYDRILANALGGDPPPSLPVDRRSREERERQAAARSVRDYLTMIEHNGELDDEGDQTTLDDGYGADGKIHALLAGDLRILSGWTK